MTRETSTSLKYWLNEPFPSRISPGGLPAPCPGPRDEQEAEAEVEAEAEAEAEAGVLTRSGGADERGAAWSARTHVVTPVSVVSSLEMRVATSLMVVFRTRGALGSLGG